MKKFILLFVLALATISYSMEKDGSISLEQTSVKEKAPFDIDLVKSAIANLSGSEDLDVLATAREIADAHIKWLENHKAKINTNEPESLSLVLETCFSAISLEQSLKTTFRVSLQTYQQTQPGWMRNSIGKTLETYKNNIVPNLTSALEAELTAWRIIKNSVQFAREYELSVEKIIPEVLRMLVTSNVNYAGNNEFWLSSIKASRQVLAVLLVKLGCEQGASAITNDLVKVSLELGKPGWHLAQYLILLNEQNKYDNESPLFLSKCGIKYFENAQQICNQANPNISEALSKTELFKILDFSARKTFSKEYNFCWLKDYNFFLGSVESYAESQRRKTEDELLQNNKFAKSKTTHKKRPTKKKKTKQQKSAQSVGEKTSLMLSSDVIGPCPPCAAIDDSPADDENSVFATDDSGSGEWQLAARKTKKKKPAFDDSLLTLGHNIYAPLHPKNLIKLSYSDLVNLSRQNEIGYMDYRNLLSIWPSKTTKYVFKEVTYDTENSFSSLETKLNCIDEGLIANHNRLGYFITFHGENDNGEDFSYTFLADKGYLSSEAPHKDYVISNDLLDPLERNHWLTSHPLQNLCLKNLISEKCNKAVANGFWLPKSLHTEPVMAIDLVQNKLSGYLRELRQQKGPLRLTGVVIGIASRFDICYRCRWLLQGLQWNLRLRLQNAIIGDDSLKSEVKIDDDLATMIIAKSHKKVDSADGRNNSNRSIGIVTLTDKRLPTLGEGDYSKYPRHQLILNEYHD